MKNNKNLIKSLAFLTFIFVTFSFIVFAPTSLKNFANALTGNYGKGATENLSASEWNNLASDFLDKQNTGGDTMAGPLTLPGDPVNPSHAATKAYVDGVAGGGGGGEVFVNWGRSSCPIGSTFLYNGFAHGAPYDIEGGSGDLMCLKYPLIGTEGSINPNNTAYSYSVGTGNGNHIPSALPASTELKCATCYQPSTCYVEYGDNGCGTGFNSLYTGWIMSRMNNITRQNQTNYVCVNDTMNADAPLVANNNNLSPMVGATIRSDADTGLYTLDSYLRCSYCCN